jgi:hypothetical protein
MAVRGGIDRTGEHSCSLSAHDRNMLGQCAQLSVHPSGLCGKTREDLKEQ